MSAVITGELTRRGRGPWASKLPLVSRPRRRGDRIRSATSAHDPTRTLGRSVWGRLAALSHPPPRRKVLGLRRRRGFPSGGRNATAGLHGGFSRPQQPWALLGGPCVLRLMLGRRSPNALR